MNEDLDALQKLLTQNYIDSLVESIEKPQKIKVEEKLGKPKSHKRESQQEDIKNGDTVKNFNGLVGIVIDIDEDSDEICVNSKGICIWKLSEVRKVPNDKHRKRRLVL